MSEIRRKNFMDLETYKEIVDAPILARIKRTAILVKFSGEDALNASSI